MIENQQETQQTNRTGRRGFLKILGAGLAGAVVGTGATGRVMGGWYDSQISSPNPLLASQPLPPSTITTTNGVKIHHLNAGFVAVKKAHRSFDGQDGMGIPAIAVDPFWTEWMPITSWVIEHPEGVIVVDTGESLRAITDENYFNCDPGTQFFYSSFLRFVVRPEEEVTAQLTALGINPSDVRWVIQTHLHSDHMGGLSKFDQSEMILSNIDYPSSVGTLACHYEPWMSPTFSTFDGEELAGLGRAMPITQAGDVMVVQTPGHTEGHQSVIYRETDRTFFFAGDTSFSETQMLEQGVAGIAMQPSGMRQTLANIRTYAESHPTVYLPSHDPDLRTRLQNQQTVSL